MLATSTERAELNHSGWFRVIPVTEKKMSVTSPKAELIQCTVRLSLKTAGFTIRSQPEEKKAGGPHTTGNQATGNTRLKVIGNRRLDVSARLKVRQEEFAKPRMQ